MTLAPGGIAHVRPDVDDDAIPDQDDLIGQHHAGLGVEHPSSAHGHACGRRHLHVHRVEVEGHAFRLQLSPRAACWANATVAVPASRSAPTTMLKIAFRRIASPPVFVRSGRRRSGNRTRAQADGTVDEDPGSSLVGKRDRADSTPARRHDPSERCVDRLIAIHEVSRCTVT